MRPNIASYSSHITNVRQDVFPIDQWTITTRKGIILQSKCTCEPAKPAMESDESSSGGSGGSEQPVETCNICKYHRALPHLGSLPDMLFNENVLRLEHACGVGIDFNALDALKIVADTKDPLQVAVADGWQNARSDFPFTRSVVKPFDWTFTTDYRGTLLSAIRKRQPERVRPGPMRTDAQKTGQGADDPAPSNPYPSIPHQEEEDVELGAEDRLSFTVEETDERIDINRLRMREEILFYDEVSLYEDELADHGTAHYNVKVRVMPNSLFILARFYLRVDNVLARINDTRIYHELNKDYLLREYTNREATLSSINQPVSVLVNPNELMEHLPIIQTKSDRLVLPSGR